MRHLPRLALIAALTGGLASAGPATAKSGAFQSPSGNIGCYISASGVRCDIAKRDWTAPAKPSSCDLDYGQGLRVGRSGKGGFVCAGDTTLSNGGPTLAYGTRRSAGRFTCTSRSSGMRCVNRRNGHGFTISRQGYKRF